MRQEETVADLQQTLHLSGDRYRGGTTTYLEVLDAQRSLYSAELTLAQARGDEYRSLVQLYKSLGGGLQQESQIQGVRPVSVSGAGSAGGHK